jgi:hypothetical protein
MLKYIRHQRVLLTEMQVKELNLYTDERRKWYEGQKREVMEDWFADRVSRLLLEVDAVRVHEVVDELINDRGQIRVVLPKEEMTYLRKYVKKMSIREVKEKAVEE